MSAAYGNFVIMCPTGEINNGNNNNNNKFNISSHSTTMSSIFDYDEFPILSDNNRYIEQIMRLKIEEKKKYPQRRFRNELLF